MRYNRLLALLVALSMLFAVTSCGIIEITDIPPFDIDAPDTSDDIAPHDKHVFSQFTKYEDSSVGRLLSEEYLGELPLRDYAGETFFITTPSAGYISPDDTASVVSRLAVERNAKVEDLLNIKLVTSVADSSVMLEGMKQAILADTYYTDLLMLPVSSVGQFQIENTLINMRSIPFFDLNKPYFNTDSSDATSAGYATYAVAGDASLSPTSYPAVFMNTDILETVGIDHTEIYSSAKAGTWTWDELLTYTEAVGGSQVYNTLTAQTTADGFVDMLFKAAGNDYVLAEQRKIPVIGYKPASVGNTTRVIESLTVDPRTVISSETNSVADFADGKTAFMVEQLYVMPWLINSRVKWGLLPLPKGDAGDEYRSLMPADQLLFAIPANHTNSEMASITLMALGAASHGYIYDEYVEYNMTYVLRDNDSVNMLDLILGTATFDFALTFGEAYPEIAAVTYELFHSSIGNEEWDKDFREKMIAATELIREEFGEEPETPEETEKENTKPAE